MAGTRAMKILLVDDSRLQRALIQRDLIAAGYKVTAAADGEEGLRRAGEELPDLILLDMMLPKISGLDVLRKLKQEPQTQAIPVVVLSGLSKGNGEKLAAEGAAGFCEKSEEAFQNRCAMLVKTVKEVMQMTARS
jgi:CheY-like chemotaxis protein